MILRNRRIILYSPSLHTLFIDSHVSMAGRDYVNIIDYVILIDIYWASQAFIWRPADQTWKKVKALRGGVTQNLMYVAMSKNFAQWNIFSAVYWSEKLIGNNHSYKVCGNAVEKYTI